MGCLVESLCAAACEFTNLTNNLEPEQREYQDERRAEKRDEGETLPKHYLEQFTAPHWRHNQFSLGSLQPPQGILTKAES